jgi:hypothetical protein
MAFNYDTWGGSWGTSWANSWGQQGAVVSEVVIPPGGGRGLDYLSWWERELRRILRERKKPKKKLPPKKKELVDELDTVLADLRAQVEARAETDAYAKEIRERILEAAQLANQVMLAQVANKQLQAEIAILEAYLRELDDEDVILLALH